MFAKKYLTRFYYICDIAIRLLNWQGNLLPDATLSKLWGFSFASLGCSHFRPYRSDALSRLKPSI